MSVVLSRTLALLALVLASAIAPRAAAHEVRPAYLELKQTSADTFDVVWKVPARGDMRLGLYVRLPADCVNLTEPQGMFTDEAFVERWSIRHPDALAGATIHIDGLATMLTDVLVRIERLDGTVTVTQLKPTNTSLVVPAAPTWWQSAATYLGIGIKHILGGVDHLLFVFGLLCLVHNRWMLLKTITAFTVAHSITLAIATFGYAHAPAAALNILIALSILFLGPEIVRSYRGQHSLTIDHPWIVAFAFGLLHGFGFASGLTELGLPRSEIPLALLMFNVGVEIGQLGFVAIMLGVWQSLKVLGFRMEAWTALLPAYIIGTLGAFWTIGRIVAAF
ncbi:MAG: HupE/UreJ family protein [Phycisphaerales bacterium]|nr:HupE/UreJ family protein [Phycisphaerales bacterium]